MRMELDVDEENRVGERSPVGLFTYRKSIRKCASHARLEESDISRRHSDNIKSAGCS
jgi:hypothetical protein